MNVGSTVAERQKLQTQLPKKQPVSTHFKEVTSSVPCYDNMSNQAEANRSGPVLLMSMSDLIDFP